MAQWGNSDAASNASIQWVSQVKKTQNTANRTDLYGNTSASYFGNKGVAGFFAVDTTEARVSGGPLAIARVATPGSGYTANTTVQINVTNGGTSGVINATSNSIGRISALNISTAGSGYKANPTIVVTAPPAITFNANTGVAANGLITMTNVFQVDDVVTYTVATGNTAVSSLVSGASYFIKTSNSSTVQLATTKGGTILTLTPSTISETGHSLRGESATGYVVAGGGQNKGVTAGWNLRTAGTGGRAGRVQNECLVAMRSISTDGADDTILPDA